MYSYNYFDVKDCQKIEEVVVDFAPFVYLFDSRMKAFVSDLDELLDLCHDMDLLK